MTVHPTQLMLSDSGRLRVEWSDGQVREVAPDELRKSCPCATCRENRENPPAPTLLPILNPVEARPLAVVSMAPVGSYAYHIGFSDDHDTGIYTLELLRSLGEQVE
jgi:DUF971 family protein